VTAKQYAAYRLMVRDDSSEDKNLVDSLFYSGRKLFQQYIVDSYIRAEDSDLRFLRRNTTKLKVDKYSNIKAYLAKKAAEQEAVVPGHIYVIPSSHTVRRLKEI